MSDKKKIQPAQANKKQEMFGLTAKQLQDLGNYLASKPYREVEELINTLKNLPKLQVEFVPELPADAPVAGEDSPPESVKQ